MPHVVMTAAQRTQPRRLWWAALLLGAVTMLSAASGVHPWLAAEPLAPAVAIDGDTLQVDGEVLQLFGIDAPELGQLCQRRGLSWHCGREAASELQKRIELGGGRVDCQRRGEGSGTTGFPEAVCQIGAEDLAQVMVETGNAITLENGSPGYGDAERYAKEAGIGIWRGSFEPPWEWRAALQNDAGERQADCLVKGVVDAAGEHLYYVPNDPDYAGVEPDAARGGRTFCTDEEASRAGWRRPGEV